MKDKTDHSEEQIFNIPVRRLAARLTVLVQREVLRPFDLRIQEWRVLWSLAREGDSHLRELARRASVDPAHVSRLVRKFETGGLIERLADPADSRRALFRITPKGRALYNEVRPQAVAVSREFSDLYTPEEYAQLMELIHRATLRADELLGQKGLDGAADD